MQNNNIESLTGLRGAAAWWVVVYHFKESLPLMNDAFLYKFVAQGYVAVDLFFILSGFVIYINYAGNFDNCKMDAIFNFYIKRLARIYPLHLLILILFLINPIAIVLFSNHVDMGDRYGFGYFFMSLFLIQNWGFTDSLAWNVPAWSISTEFAAYLIFPFAINLFRRTNAFGSACLLLLFFAILLFIPMVFTYFNYKSLGEGIAKIGVIRCISEFVLGMIAGNVFRSRAYLLQDYFLIYPVFMVTILAMGIYFDLSNYYYLPFCFCALILTFVNKVGLIDFAFGAGPLHFLGEISYSTYLVHFFIKDWVKFLSPEIKFEQFLLYILFTFAVSIFLYRFVEVPGQYFMKNKLMKFYKGVYRA